MLELKRPLKVFLYHAPIDRSAVRDLYLRLIQDGVDAWLVKEKLPPSQDWKHEIHRAVCEADVVVICLSGQFNQGEFRQKEVQGAFEAVIEQLEDEIFIIPVRLEECDWLENMEKWQWVDLFEEAGYERLMHALQAQANRIGATIQMKEGSLPRITNPSLKHEEPLPEKKPVEAIQAIPVEGSGILIEDPAVISQHKPGRALIAALIGFAGIILMAMFGPSQLERWGPLTPATGSETTQTSTPRTEIGSVVVPRLKPISTLTAKGNISNIVFLIDTSGSMGGQRIRNVKSAVSDFISKLNNRYFVSVIEFDTDVELRISSTRDYAAASELMESITVDVTHNGSCIRDALYAGIQESLFAPIATDTGNMIVLLTDVSLGENVGWNCSFPFDDDLINLALNHPVATFAIRIGNDFDEASLVTWTVDMEVSALAADNEKEIDGALLSISRAAGLELNAESITPAPEPAETGSAPGAPMVFVPPGEFMMGNNKVYTDPFWIDKTEVTNAMYAKCVQAGTCSAPSSNRSRTRASYYGSTVFGNYPVVFVSWLDARDYCAWAGRRLPTEAEWEKAARGTDGRQFPWGDDEPSSLIALLNYQAQDTAEVGSYPDGASPYGALDMAGNVAEWVADWLSLDYYRHPPASNPLGPDSGQYRVWRGGSWANTSTESISTYSRTGNLPTDTSTGIGFRCARDAAP